MKNKINHFLSSAIIIAIILSICSINTFAADYDLTTPIGCASFAESKTGINFSETKGITNGATYCIRNVNSNKYLDINTSNLNVRQWSFTGYSNQRWKCVYSDDGYYYLISDYNNNSLYLDIYYGQDNNGTNVDVYTLDSADQKLFRIKPTADGAFTIQPKTSNNRDIEVENSLRDDGRNVQLWTRGSRDNEKWCFEPCNTEPAVVNGATYYIRNANSNKYLDYGSDTISGNNVRQMSFTGDTNQQWKCVLSSDGYYHLVPQNNTNMSLENYYGVNADGTNVDTYYYSENNNNQLYRFISTGNGSYYIQPKISSTRDLEVVNSSSNDGANVQLWTNSGRNNEKWYLEFCETEQPLTNGATYYIRNVNSNKYLDVDTSNLNVRQWSFTGYSNQQWTCVYHSDGYYYLVPQYDIGSKDGTGKCLDNYYARDADGTNVDVWSYNGSDNQLYRVVPAGNGSFYIQPKISSENTSDNPKRDLEVVNSSTNDGANVQLWTNGRRNNEKWRFDLVSDNSDSIKVISSNIENDQPENRIQQVVWYLNVNKPDSFGVQEGTYSWLNFLSSVMSDYAYVGVGLNGTDNKDCGQANAIFYLKDKYTVVNSGTFYFSNTPDIPSSYPGISENRNCTWAVLRNKKTGKSYVHLNTHLSSNTYDNPSDVVCAQARANSASEIMDKINSFNLPVICTGDFNSSYTDQPYKTMISGKMKDSRYLAQNVINPGGTCDDVDINNPIDFCFVSSNDFSVQTYKVLRDKVFDNYPSDHHAVIIQASFR